MITPSLRRLLATALVALGLPLLFGLFTCASADAKPLNLETLTGTEAEEMLEKGQITSVELVKDYYARIAALNKAGPGLNAVTQLNPLRAGRSQEDRSGA